MGTLPKKHSLRLHIVGGDVELFDPRPPSWCPLVHIDDTPPGTAIRGVGRIARVVITLPIALFLPEIRPMKRLTLFLFAAAVMVSLPGCNGGNCRLFQRQRPVECMPPCCPQPMVVDDCCGTSANMPMMVTPSSPAPLPAPNIQN